MIKNYIALFIIYIFNLLPIKKNKIFFFSYYGSQYGCSPKYISEYILKNYPKDKFDVVWAFNDLNGKEHLSDFRKVKIMTFRYFYELCTSKIVITNFRTTDLYVKRKNQYYIQTWHSFLRLKQIEKDAEESLPSNYINMAKKDSRKCDLLLSGCDYSSDIFKRAFWYEGDIFEHGTPRNDLLFKDNSFFRNKILKELDVQDNQKIILYAPTFRKDNNLEVYNIQYSNIMERLKNKFGGEWVFLVKLHPHLMSQSSQLTFYNNVIDVTSYDDIQELLSIADVLITDYSSLMFDFAITQRPCFLFVPDLVEYIKKDRNLYFDIKELPFISAENTQELLDKIESFDNTMYSQRLSYFLKRVGSFESGKANEHLLKHIEEVCFNDDRRKGYEKEAV
ncbi:CDP-glycerol glycerophosphotransferase [Neobacillus niacini]|uniref:CDP-glycerol glycerophosphotransferase family protein n=1 Tax=Neobacillus driksii TaxID=3035913 RepID=UPI002783AD9C|nr:CDP-glycerol glycerophosphotransferase family protein [Neobacillus niacini]MDQ0975374.1 CDP-glycerol glycerophosphotransferase [Neobacillus niacini]